MAQLQAVGRISDEATNAPPVRDIWPAVAFYEAVLGFSVVFYHPASMDRG